MARIRAVAGPALAAVRSFVRARFRRRPKPAVPMKPYVNLNSVPRRVSKILLPLFLGMFCLVYGFYFALTAPYLIVPFAAPIFILILLSIWALPERRNVPTKTMEFLFSGILISLILWPNYLALSMPGLPWITAERLFGFPMAATLLVCLSGSSQFRREIREAIAAVPWLGQTFLVFVVMQFITLPFSKAINQSLQKALIQQIDWTSMFVIGVWVCRQPGRVLRYVSMVILLVIPIFIITMEEIQHHQVLWNGHVPSFLKINDPVAALILAASVRGATGLYRAKATFTTPLGLGEYMGLLAPFGFHMVIGARSLWIRLGGAALLAMAFVAIRLADARLGMVGMFVSVILYGLYWGLQRFRRSGGDLIAATFVYAYPAIFAVATAGVMFVKPMHRLVFGGGEQAASNEARQNQLRMGIPKVLQNPIGHGASQSGDALGYAAGQFVSVDNYWLTIALDYGIIGLTAFVLIFLQAVSEGSKVVLRSSKLDDPEVDLLVPLSVALSAFLVMKLVFSQPDNHPLVFALLGMTVGLTYRAKVALAAAAPVVEPAPAPPADTGPRLTKPAPKRLVKSFPVDQV